MCRNIKTLFNFAPPATDEEIHAASLQYVRKRQPRRKRAQPYDSVADHTGRRFSN
jgi:hypothetical protein